MAKSVDVRTYVDLVPPEIDRDLIGPHLGSGGYHHVFTYGPDQVVKLPRPDTVKSPQTADQIEQDYNLASQYFAARVLPTSIYPFINEHTSYCLVQPLLEPFVTVSSLNAYLVAEQLTNIIEQNNSLVDRENRSLDFFGRESILNFLKSDFLQQKQATIGNLCINQQGKVVIHDFSLFRLGQNNSSSMQNYFDFWATQTGIVLQTMLLNRYFGLKAR